MFDIWKSYLNVVDQNLIQPSCEVLHATSGSNTFVELVASEVIYFIFEMLVN